MNKMNPMTPIAPTVIKNAVNPAESPKMDVGTVPVAADNIVDIISETTPITAASGKITEIKLAINPNFLPDSIDILQPSIFTVHRFRDKVFCG
jgi:hypothetical protein